MILNQGLKSHNNNQEASASHNYTTMILLTSIQHVLDESDMTVYPAGLAGEPIVSMGKEWRDLEEEYWENISGKDLSTIFYYDALLDLEVEFNIQRRELKTKWRVE